MRGSFRFRISGLGSGIQDLALRTWVSLGSCRSYIGTRVGEQGFNRFQHCADAARGLKVLQTIPRNHDDSG